MWLALGPFHRCARTPRNTSCVRSAGPSRCEWLRGLYERAQLAVSTPTAHTRPLHFGRYAAPCGATKNKKQHRGTAQVVGQVTKLLPQACVIHHIPRGRARAFRCVLPSVLILLLCDLLGYTAVAVCPLPRPCVLFTL